MNLQKEMGVVWSDHVVFGAFVKFFPNGPHLFPEFCSVEFGWKDVFLIITIAPSHKHALLHPKFLDGCICHVSKKLWLMFCGCCCAIDAAIEMDALSADGQMAVQTG